jgi:hypothetical protein
MEWLGPEIRRQHVSAVTLTFRMRLSSSLVQLMTLLQQGLVESLMTLCWCYETNAAMAVFMAIPVNETLDPLPRRLETAESFPGPLRPVFQRPEQRLRERIVVGYPGPAMRRHNAQCFQPGFEAVALLRPQAPALSPKFCQRGGSYSFSLRLPSDGQLSRWHALSQHLLELPGQPGLAQNRIGILVLN